VLYSTRFLYTVTGQAQADYQVPAGKLAILRSGDFANYSATVAAASIAIGSVAFAKGSLPASTGWWHWEGRQVAYAGEILHAYTSGGDCRGIVSGYLFDAQGAEYSDLIGEPELAPPGFLGVPL
jgi:hypothetical protein